MAALITAVFVASVLGSLHCAGMCGAFVAFAVGSAEEDRSLRVKLNAAYNLGRLLTYVALGIAAGAVGALLDLGGTLAGVSRIAALLAGAVMVLFGAVALAHAMGRSTRRLPVPALMHKLLAAGHRAAMAMTPIRRALVIGLLTTLLPCGWLYAFAAAAAGTASPLWGAVTMAAFWLGTLPVLASLGAGVQRLTGALGRKLPHATAVVLIIVGLWTVAGRWSFDAAALASQQPVSTDLHNAALNIQRAGDQTPECCKPKP